jgi:hypothetical protein
VSWNDVLAFEGAVSAGSFPIDRRALADHAGLNLTEARVRGAIRTLEAVGFLDRAIPAPGSLYKPTADGLHRKPVLFVFGSDYAPAFIAANARAAAARGRHSRERRPSAAVSEAPALKSPKNIKRSGSSGEFWRAKKMQRAAIRLCSRLSS